MNSRGPLDWTDDEFSKLLEAAESLVSGEEYRRPLSFRKGYRFRENGGHYCKPRDWWKAYLYVARETGFSWRKLRRLRTIDISARGILSVTFTAPAEVRSVQLSKEALAALAALPSRRGRLLGITFVDTSLTRCFRQLLKLSGIWKPADKSDRAALRFSQAPREGAQRPAVVNSEGITKDSKLVDFFEAVYAKLRLGGKSGRTVVLYRNTLRNFDKTLGRPARLTDLVDDVVEGHLCSFGNRLNCRGVKASPHTIEKERNQLLAIWRFACQRRLIELYPTVQPRKLPERKPTGWLIEDLGKLFTAAKSMPGTVNKIAANVWWPALLYVLYDTAERIGAIRQLTWDHVDLAGGWITVPAEYRKGGTRDVVSRLHPETIAALRDLKATKAPLFQLSRTQSNLYHRYDQVLQRAGLPTDCRSKFHRIRRTAASYFERAGGDATSLLDHSSRKVTKKYLDARIVERKHASDVLPRPAIDDGKGGDA
jgi:integrase